MALEILFIDSDVLDRGDSMTMFVLNDAVDEQRWISVGEPVENERDVEGHQSTTLAYVRASVYKVRGKPVQFFRRAGNSARRVLHPIEGVWRR